MKLHPIKLLIGACLTLSLTRVFIHWDMIYLFLVWNLFLAWIAYPMADTMIRTKRWYVALFSLGLSMLFLPNAAYLVTDLIHFRKSTKIDPWFDLVLFSTYAITGLVLTYYTVKRLTKGLSKYLNVRWIRVSQFAIFAAIGIGIYLGRVERFNSWDAILNPLDFVSSMIWLGISDQRYELLGFSALYAAFTGLTYTVLRQFELHHSDV